MQQNTMPEQAVPEQVRAIRTIEERYNNLVRRVQLGEQNSLSSSKKSQVEIKAMNSELLEVKKQIDELREKVDTVLRELTSLARKEEIDVLKKYLNLWEPINFVTQNEVEKIVQEAIGRNKQ